MKRYILTFLKFAVPVAIIAWLIVSVERTDPGTFRRLGQQEKDWRLLGAALCVSLAAISITYTRWYLLVRALELPFRLRDAFRLGFLGFLFNFVSAGSVGGDLFKAFFIARSQPGRRTEAVATIVVDRLIGLYALVVVTSLAILLVGVPQSRPDIVSICWGTLAAVVLGGLAIALVLAPGFTTGSVAELLVGLPRVGTMFGRLIAALRMYRSKPHVLAVIGGMSLVVHCLHSLSIYLISGALYGFSAVPRLSEHLIMVPLSMVFAALPVFLGGLGGLELALQFLYQHVPADGGSAAQGLVVALAFRMVTITVAVVGVFYYWTNRESLTQVLHEAELEQQKEHEGKAAR